MIDCQGVKEFREIFQLICIVALNERDDSIIKTTGQTVAQARHELKKIIATRDFSQILSKLDSSEIDESKINNWCDKKDTEYDIDPSEPSPIKTFIDNIFNSAKNLKVLGKIANAYYADDFIKDFLPRAREFPLWTSACFAEEVEHATTSYVEQFFGDKKERSLSKWKGLVRADVFLKHEYEEYSGSSAELISNLIVDVEREKLNIISQKHQSKLNTNSDKSKPSKNDDTTDDLIPNNIDRAFKKKQ
ncbi:NOF_8 protein [Trichonephila clavata]|uniref:NOF_8 protein n=1 Tax=Trichonephila clavata TaxID=2740835 RepID=A0A8X6KAK8_TRICU|nr:NOF_8 protein [Trichonephila clavata]